MSRRPPYDPARLVRLSETWDFQSDAEETPDCDDGEPRLFRASRRIKAQLRVWRDAHGPDDDPWFDESLVQFHMADVALLYSEVCRLWRLGTSCYGGARPTHPEYAVE
jgi:hypothetical protein